MSLTTAAAGRSPLGTGWFAIGALALGLAGCSPRTTYELDVTLLGSEGCDVRFGVAPLPPDARVVRYHWVPGSQPGEYVCQDPSAPFMRYVRMQPPQDAAGTPRVGEYAARREPGKRKNVARAIFVDHRLAGDIRLENFLPLGVYFDLSGRLRVTATDGKSALTGHLTLRGKPGSL